METNVTVFGTVDDHDMGMNNADETYEFKKESGLEFLRFTGEDHESPVYKRTKKGYGVYGVKVFDFDDDRISSDYLLSDEEAGIDPDVITARSKAVNNVSTKSDDMKEVQNKRVAIFFLDVRTNRTPWKKGLDAWRPNYDGDFLGDRQWEWFEKALGNSDASVNVIVNGLQAHSYRHPNANLAEVWANAPTSRQRLYDTIIESGAQAPILVSGDVHMSQLMRKDCWQKENDANADGHSPSDTHTRPLIEFTTSGMTHSWGTTYTSSQKFHNNWLRYYPMHIMSVTLMSIAHWILPMPDLIDSSHATKKNLERGEASTDLNSNRLFENGGAEGAATGKQYAMDLNFGEIEFDFDNRIASIRALGKDINAPPLLSATYSFDQLSGTRHMPGAIANITSYGDLGGVLMDGNIIPEGLNTCMNHRGPPDYVQLTAAVIIWHSVLISFLVGPQLLLVYFLQRYVRRKL